MIKKKKDWCGGGGGGGGGGQRGQHILTLDKITIYQLHFTIITILLFFYFLFQIN